MPQTDHGSGRHAGLPVTVPGLGPVRLVTALARNAETAIYQTDHAGIVAKVFDLDCPQPDEIGYGPYVNFQAELATFEELQVLEPLRGYIPAYYGAGVDYDRKFAFIAMEHLPGVTLRVWAEELAGTGYDHGALDELRRAAQEVLAIVDRFHQHGLVLVDFKPDNVLRRDDGVIRLVDLGAFFTPRHREAPGSFVYTATPDHAEVVIDASNLQAGLPPGMPSDVFSAGVALFELATGNSRLALAPATAEEMLADPALYRFRDSQIADVWKAFPHLKEALPLVQTQLREHRLLFAEFWHLLKAYLASRVPDWESLGPAERESILLSTGTTFVLDQLPPPLAWLAAAIARATVLRSLRVPDLNQLGQLLVNPAPDEILDDIAVHNTFVRQLAALGLTTTFAARLNLWDVWRVAATGHWAIAAPAAAWELAENATCVFLRQVTTSTDGDQTWWEAVDEFAADLTTDGDRLCLAHLGNDHQAWLV